MSRISIYVLLILSLAWPSFAGNIYGSIAEAGKPVAQGVKITVTCGAKDYSADTDAHGSFKLFVADKGKCVLKVNYQGQSPTLEVNSYDGSVQYDLLLEKTGNQYTLKRK